MPNIKHKELNMTNVVKQLNQIQADAHALFVAFHNYHWLVKGVEFNAIHAYTEDAYEALSTLFDDTAERAIIIGGAPVSSVSELEKLAKAPFELKSSYKSIEVLELVRKAYIYLIDEFKKLENVAEEAKDSGTVAIAQEQYAALQKKVWMLNATLA